MSRIDAALFLAAGRGVRLGPRGHLIPKGFLELDGITLVERAVGQLRAAGIEEIVVVTGHLAGHYEALAERLGGGVRTVFNPDYARLGSGHSLAVGLAATPGEVLVLESDLVWEGRALEAVRDAEGDSVLLVSGETASGDEVWVWADPEAPAPRLGGMSKQRRHRPEAAWGELVGLTRIGPALRPVLAAEIARATAEKPLVDYETCLVGACRTAPVELVRIEDLAWSEIDDEGMYARVVAEVWPRIRDRDG